jgi:hypothetical protein
VERVAVSPPVLTERLAEESPVGPGDGEAVGTIADLRSASLPTQLATTIPVITAVVVTSAIPIAAIFQIC